MRVKRRGCDEAITLVELMVTVVILTAVVFGTVAFIVSGRTTVERAGQDRAAVQLATERLDRARAGGYDALAGGQGTVYMEGTTYTWIITVTTARADPADSNSIYKRAEITVDWPTSRGRPVMLRTAVSP